MDNANDLCRIPVGRNIAPFVFDDVHSQPVLVSWYSTQQLVYSFGVATADHCFVSTIVSATRNADDDEEEKLVCGFGNTCSAVVVK
mmetsp:Transcript_21958/g.62554  ORF Transcript_21958/g.62554 Transcript_21958/m.62554 type:complete len:86 (-) Transcript_21958:100-357(-)